MYLIYKPHMKYEIAQIRMEMIWFHMIWATFACSLREREREGERGREGERERGRERGGEGDVYRFEKRGSIRERGIDSGDVYRFERRGSIRETRIDSRDEDRFERRGSIRETRIDSRDEDRFERRGSIRETRCPVTRHSCGYTIDPRISPSAMIDAGTPGWCHYFADAAWQTIKRCGSGHLGVSWETAFTSAWLCILKPLASTDVAWANFFSILSHSVVNLHLGGDCIPVLAWVYCPPPPPHTPIYVVW